MRHRTLAALVASALISTGCATWFDPPEKTHRASVVDYLYPQNERPALKPTVPELHLPLRVGIAFVPGDLRGDLPEVERNNLLNRVKSGLYPASVCGVVYQNRNRHLACQFTFACEGKALRITEPGPWRDATRIAREVYEGTTYLADVGASTHYHADYVRPYWARKLKKMDTIGRHVFYKLRPGQT